MKKSPKKTDSASQDAIKLGGLYLLCFVGFQIGNFIDVSIKNTTFIDTNELASKAMSQFGAFLIAYFITLIYIKNRTS